jgi:hypothetical protein
LLLAGVYGGILFALIYSWSYAVALFRHYRAVLA